MPAMQAKPEKAPVSAVCRQPQKRYENIALPGGCIRVDTVAMPYSVNESQGSMSQRKTSKTLGIFCSHVHPRNYAAGRLMRTILYSTEHVSANNWETGLFILFLMVFAIAASAYVLYHGLQASYILLDRTPAVHMPRHLNVRPW